MSVTRVHAVSNVELLSLILWAYVHLPAALLASALLKPLGFLPVDPTQMPDSALLVTGLFGLLQTFAISYWAWVWWLKPAKADAC